jgi:cephalosporin hydroxylase
MTIRIVLAAAVVVGVAGCLARVESPPLPKDRELSRFTDLALGEPGAGRNLISGFTGSNGAWRFTSRIFRFRMDPPESGGLATWLELDFAVPEEQLSENGSFALTGRVNGVEIGRRVYASTGYQRFAAHIPELALRSKPAVVEFEVDRSFKEWRTGDVRTLIALRASMLPYEATEEWRITQAVRARADYRKIQDGRQKLPQAKQAEMDRWFRGLSAWKNLTFHGIPVTQNPLDLWILQQILYEVRPTRVIEIGTGRGGAALYLARVLTALDFRESQIVTVDAVDSTAQARGEAPWGKVLFRQGSAADPKLAREIVDGAAGQTAVVVLNYDGSAENLLAWLRLYAPAVSPGSYLVAANIRPEGARVTPAAGAAAMSAIQRFLSEPAGKEFAADPIREMFLTSWNEGGWLKRKPAAIDQAPAPARGGE